MAKLRKGDLIQGKYIAHGSSGPSGLGLGMRAYLYMGPPPPVHVKSQRDRTPWCRISCHFFSWNVFFLARNIFSAKAFWILFWSTGEDEFSMFVVVVFLCEKNDQLGNVAAVLVFAYLSLFFCSIKCYYFSVWGWWVAHRGEGGVFK